MSTQPPPQRSIYLNKEESFMYDREKNFPMDDTFNEARIEFTENGGIVKLASRRCQIIRLSRSGALLKISTKFNLPKNFYLDVVSARLPMIGCLALRVHVNDTVEARFLRLLAEKDMKRIFVYSAHPNHRNQTLDIYS